MADTNLIASAKQWLRTTTDTVNDEIEQVIEACLIDLKNAGVTNTDSSNPMIQQAIKLYLKSQFGYDVNADGFAKAYEFLKSSLALSGDFNAEE